MTDKVSFSEKVQLFLFPTSRIKHTSVEPSRVGPTVGMRTGILFVDISIPYRIKYTIIMGNCISPIIL